MVEIYVSELIDRIYQAAERPQLWPAVLSTLSDHVQAAGALLVVGRQHGAHTVTSASINKLGRDYVAEGWLKHDPRRARIAAAGLEHFCRSTELFSGCELEREPIFTQFFHPRGFHGFAGAGFPLPADGSAVLTFESVERGGPLSEEALRVLDGLWPHLARAFGLSARTELLGAQARVATLRLLGLPAAVLSPERAVLASNELFAPYLPDPRRSGKATFARRGADDRVFLALERCMGVGHCPEATPIAGTESRAPLLLHTVPLTPTAENPFAVPASLVVVAPVSRGPVPTVEVIRQLFDLTPAEARVAHGIGAGETVDELAARSKVSPAAIRFHLKSVFAKSALSRQADLVALLSGCGAIRLAPAEETSPAEKSQTAGISRLNTPLGTDARIRSRPMASKKARPRQAGGLAPREESLRE